jgi:CheY-like chemotaxis protein
MPPPSTENPCKVLIVEDDDGARAALGDIFDGEGFQVACSPNGQEALDYLRKSPAPDIIILDLQMPVMDGWKFRREQKKDQRFAKVPVVVVTAFSPPENIDAAAILQKPIDVEKLLGVVRQYC